MILKTFKDQCEFLAECSSLLLKIIKNNSVFTDQIQFSKDLCQVDGYTWPAFIEIDLARNDDAISIEPETNAILLARLYSTVVDQVKTNKDQPLDLGPFFADASFYVDDTIQRSGWMKTYLLLGDAKLSQVYHFQQSLNALTYEWFYWFASDAVKFLYKYGHHDIKNSELCYAAIKYGYYIKPYLDHKEDRVDVNAKHSYLGEEPCTLLNNAVRANDNNAVQVLLHHGAIASSDDLVTALRYKNQLASELLLKYNAMPTFACLRYIAIYPLTENTIKLILDKLPLNSIDNEYGVTPLRYLLTQLYDDFDWRTESQIIAAIEEILKRPIIFDVHISYKGETLIELANRVIASLSSKHFINRSSQYETTKALYKKLDNILDQLKVLQQKSINQEVNEQPVVISAELQTSDTSSNPNRLFAKRSLQSVEAVQIAEVSGENKYSI